MNLPGKFLNQKEDGEVKGRNVSEDAAIYRIIMGSSLIPLCVFNSRGKILDFSPAMIAMLKCSREKFYGKKIGDYLDQEGKRKLCVKVRKPLLHEVIYSGEIGLKTFDGQFKQVECTVSSLREDLYLMLCIQDSTVCREGWRPEDEYIYIMSQVSHELRRPLATISACLDLFHASFQKKLKEIEYLKLGEIDKRERKFNFDRDFRYLATAVKSVEQMAALINSILDLARLDLDRIILDKQKFMLEDLLKEVVEETQLTNPDKNIKLLGAEKKGVLAVEADPVSIRGVVENIVSNAVKYSPPAGEIVIAAERRETYALVSVQDQGIGVAPEDLSLVFERFYMTTQAKKLGLGGMGLGLYISKQLIKLHRGRIWLESREGEGSTFYFTLPLYIA